MRRPVLTLLLALGVSLSLGWWPTATAQESKMGFTTDLGLVRGAPDGTHFAIGFGLDYYVDPAFSFGLMTLFTPTSDLNSYGFAGAAKYHVRFDRVALVPFAGVGFMHMNLDKSGPPRIDSGDTSYWIPLGVSLEYPVVKGIAFSGTVMVNLHRIRLDPIERDDTSLAILFGMHYGP